MDAFSFVLRSTWKVGGGGGVIWCQARSLAIGRDARRLCEDLRASSPEPNLRKNAPSTQGWTEIRENGAILAKSEFKTNYCSELGFLSVFFFQKVFF